VIHTGFVSVPDGAFTDAGVLPAPPQMPAGLAASPFFAATYLGSQKWLRMSRNLLSPDGTRYAYWTVDASNEYEVHVADVATGADRVLYRNATLFLLPIAFEADGIYLVQVINLRQGSLINLYRLNPSGGAPQLLSGSTQHKWVLIDGGAAWGVDSAGPGNAVIYSVYRLDLLTGQDTLWLAGPPNDSFWPLGVDGMHRLYVSDFQQLWRLTAPSQVAQLANPGPISPIEGAGDFPGFISDSLGVWFSGQGSVWLYSDDGPPQRFIAGPSDAMVLPAGQCI
jgi:hypothetical protein